MTEHIPADSRPFVVEIRCQHWGTYIQGPYESRVIAIRDYVMQQPAVGWVVYVRRASDDDLQVLEAV